MDLRENSLVWYTPPADAGASSSIVGSRRRGTVDSEGSLAFGGAAAEGAATWAVPAVVVQLAAAELVIETLPLVWTGALDVDRYAWRRWVLWLFVL